MAMNSTKSSHMMSRAHLKGHSRNIFQVDQIKTENVGGLKTSDIAEYVGNGAKLTQNNLRNMDSLSEKSR